MWERLYKEWKGRGVEFVGIGVLDGREQSRSFVQRHHLTFPNGWDGGGTIARAYGFTYQPYWAVISRDGMLRHASFGPANEQELVAAIKSVSRR